jgi:hypothetical protein
MIVVAIVDVVIVAMVIAALRADFHDNLCVSLRGNRTNRKKHTQTENQIRGNGVPIGRLNLVGYSLTMRIPESCRPQATYYLSLHLPLFRNIRV